MANQLIKNITRLSDLPELTKAEGKTIIAYNRENYQIDLSMIRGKKISRIQEYKSTNSETPNFIVLKFTDGSSYTLRVFNGSPGDEGKQGIQGNKGETGDPAVIDFERAYADGQLIIVNEIVTLDTEEDEHDNTCYQVWSAYRGKYANEKISKLNETFLTEDEYARMFDKDLIQYINAEFTSSTPEQQVLIFNYDTNPHIRYRKFWTYEDSTVNTYYVYNTVTGNYDPVMADIWNDIYLGEHSGFFPISGTQLTDGTQLYYFDEVDKEYKPIEVTDESSTDEFGNLVITHEFSIKYFDVDLDEYINAKYDYVNTAWTYSLDAATEIEPLFYAEYTVEVVDAEEHPATAEEVEAGIATEVGQIIPKKSHEEKRYRLQPLDTAVIDEFSVYFERVEENGKVTYKQITDMNAYLATKPVRWFKLNSNGRFDEIESIEDVDTANFQEYMKVTIDNVESTYTFHRWYPYTKYGVTSYKEVEKVYGKNGIELYSYWEDRTYYIGKLVERQDGDNVVYEMEYTPILIPDWIIAEFTTVDEDETCLILNSVREIGAEDNTEPDTTDEDYEEEEAETIPVQFMVAGDVPTIYKKEGSRYYPVNLESEIEDHMIFWGSSGLVVNDTYYLEGDPTYEEVLGSNASPYDLLYEKIGSTYKLYNKTIVPDDTYYVKRDHYEEFSPLSFAEHEITLFAGVPYQLKLTFYPGDSNNRKVMLDYDPDVITFYENGRIASMEENGTTDIYLTPETGQGIHIHVTLTTPMKTISLTDEGCGITKTPIIVGDITTLNARIKPATTSVKKIDYSLSDDVVSISEQVLTGNDISVELTGTKQGIATITLDAHDGYGAQAAAEIEVVTPVESVEWAVKSTPGVNDITYHAETYYNSREADAYNMANGLHEGDEGYIIAGVTVKEPAYYSMTILKGKEYPLPISIEPEDSSKADMSWDVDPPLSAIVYKTAVEKTDVPARPATEADVDNNLADEVGEIIPAVTHTEEYYAITGSVSGECTVRGFNEFNKNYFGDADNHLLDTSVELQVSIIQSVDQIIVEPSTLVFNMQSSKMLSATVLPENANKKDYKWVSDDTTIATVDETTGKVTGVGPGTVNIKAVAQDGSGTEGICIVTITVPMSNLSFDSGLVYVGVGQTVNITAKTLNINIENPSLVWKSTNDSIVTVSGSGMTGTLAGHQIGTATIIATDATNSGTMGTIQVAVIELVKNITFEGDAIMNVNDMMVLTPVFNQTEAPSIQALEYTSFDTSIATVNNDGIVTAISVGTVEITATATDGSGVTGTCSITIE